MARQPASLQLFSPPNHPYNPSDYRETQKDTKQLFPSVVIHIIHAPLETTERAAQLERSHHFSPGKHVSSPDDCPKSRTCPMYFFPEDQFLTQCEFPWLSYSYQKADDHMYLYNILNEASSPAQARLPCLLHQNDATVNSPCPRGIMIPGNQSSTHLINIHVLIKTTFIKTCSNTVLTLAPNYQAMLQQRLWPWHSAN